MPSILGLIGTEQLANFRFKNVRRSVFYDYPNGAAPLTGILSLMDEESTNDPEYSWWEKRMAKQITATASQGSSKGPFFLADGTTDAGDPVSFAAGTEYQVKVVSTAQFRIGHVIMVQALTSTGGTVIAGDLFGVVTAITDSTRIKFKCLKALASVDNGVTNENVSKVVMGIGSSASQAQVGAGLAVYNTPVEIANYCQIFRTAFQISGTALKTSAKYDDTGVYKDQAKEASLDHMIGIERAVMFGEKTKDADTNVPRYTTGGILWFLRQWELGTVYGNSASAITTNVSDDKRIIDLTTDVTLGNTAAKLSDKTMDTLLERVFRVTNNKANEKLVLCGSGFLNLVNRLYKSKTQLMSDIPMKDTYGMAVVKHVTPFGTIYYKTHPLFSNDASLRFSALFVDAGNLKWRYLDGRDTELLTERQANNADYREDEWLTEGGLELHYPESFMYLTGATDIE